MVSSQDVCVGGEGEVLSEEEARIYDQLTLLFKS